MSTAVSHVIILDEDPSHPPLSGAENHLLTLIRGQRAANVDVELIVVLFRMGPVLEKRLEELREIGVTVTVIRTWLEKPGRFTALFNVPQIITSLRNMLRNRRERIVHTHLFLTDRLAVPAARLAGHRRVMTSIHNSTPQLGQGFLRRQYRWLEGMTSQYIAISSAVRDRLVNETGLTPERVHVVHYGLEPPGEERDCETLRQLHDIPADRFVVGFVGRLTEAKNLPLFLQALQKLPQIHAVIVGFGELEDKLHAQAKQLGLSNVQFLGHQPNGPELMRAFDVFCLPSAWEGLGLVLLEAMLRNVPLIGSTAGAIPEILNHGEYGLLFESGNLEQLVDRIRCAAENSDQLRATADNARTYALERFTVEAMVKRTQAVYDLVSKNPR